jgi:energy-converting hydrogenase B subunit D
VTPLQDVALVVVALAGALVVLSRQPGRQAVMVSIYGLVLAALFFTLSAPDVASAPWWSVPSPCR